MILPTGTVTFLFTDIEGSTKLWETQPDAMHIALERHDVLMRNAIETNGGMVFKTMGDAFCAAFATAPEALEAALMAQQSLHQIKAGVGSDLLKVRMALHTGAAERRNEDYFGQPLNRVSRLLAAGHGGQVLLSQATCILVSDRLPKHAYVHDMGEHRLRDLQRAEHVFQLSHPDLRSDFPPLKSLDHLPNNLPRQLTSFIGREKEMAEIAALLLKTSLLTLTGSGGCGKTRLSLQVAADVMDQYSDGVWFVELAPISDPGLVPQTVAQALSIREAPGEPIAKTLLTALKSRQMLLILDNCEHQLDATARLVDAMLHGCTKVKILVSSREGLGIAGETTYRVPSLSLPDPKQPQTPESLRQYESVRLFIDRATQVHTAFAVTNENASALASICSRLDGIPLAIELAAARVRALTVEQIVSLLDNRFRLLTGGSRTAMPRQQTLRAMIDWSFELLEENQKVLLCRLSAFAGGWLLEAAENVCSDGIVVQSDVLDLLTALVDKSLVVMEERGQAARYHLLETVRQYARDRLVEGSGSNEVRARHLGHFTAFVDSADVWGNEQVFWIKRLVDEHDNVRAALDWCHGFEDGIEGGLRLAGAFWKFWYIRGHFTEGRAYLRQALERQGAEKPTAARAFALNAEGWLAQFSGDAEHARPLHAEALAIFEELGDKNGRANAIACLARLTKDCDLSQSMHEEALALFRDLGSSEHVAIMLARLGRIALYRYDAAAARALHEEGLAISREAGYKNGISVALQNLGEVALVQGDYATARRHTEESLATFREVGQLQQIAVSLVNLGCVATYEGDYESARKLYEESLAIYRDLGVRQDIYELLSAFASLAATHGRTVAAATLWGAVEAQKELTKWSPPLTSSTMGLFERHVPEARLDLGEDAFAAAWEKGRAMSMEEACELALKEASN